MDDDDDSGWLVNKPINPFALDLNDEGEETGYRKIHLGNENDGKRNNTGVERKPI
jgi:hypothetical protein